MPKTKERPSPTVAEEFPEKERVEINQRLDQALAADEWDEFDEKYRKEEESYLVKFAQNLAK